MFKKFIDRHVIARAKKILPKEIIKELYLKIAREELLITTDIINVKKGSRRFTLLILHDKNGKTVFNLGRH